MKGMEVTVDVRDAVSAYQLLQAETPKIAKRALYRACQPLAAAMRARIPKKTGATAKTIRVFMKKGWDVVAEAYVGPNTRGKSARAHIARFLEYGYVRKNLQGGITHVPARPWLRPATDATAGRIHGIFAQQFKAELEKVRR